MKYTNKHNISLATAVWLIYSEYDHIDLPNYISATTLLKPIKQIILGSQFPKQDMDISDLIASASGTAIHSGVEKAWLSNKETDNRLLKQLGYGKQITDNLLINPTEAEIKAATDPICVYLEKRTIKEFEGFNVGGKFDLVIDGELHDHKRTSVYKYLKEDSGEDYILQGSIYRWLNPDIITSDTVHIEFHFSDWSKIDSLRNPNYPKLKVASKQFKLMSLEETEEWVRKKLNQIRKLQNASQEKIPDCTDEELWRSETKYKYFSSADNTRASKVETTLEKIKEYAESKGNKGVIKQVPGEVKRCLYCSAFDNCLQRLNYEFDES